LVDHKDYGHKRIALGLKMGHNRIRRVMKKSIILNPTEDAINRGLRRKIWEKKATGILNLVQPRLEQKLLVKPKQVWYRESLSIWLLSLIFLPVRWWE